MSQQPIEQGAFPEEKVQRDDSIDGSIFSEESLEKLTQEQLQKLDELANNGEWKAIEPPFFPAIPKKHIALFRTKALHIRIQDIKEEYVSLQESLPLLSDPEEKEGQNIALGQQEVLEDELNIIMGILYPEIKKEDLKNTSILRQAQLITLAKNRQDWEEILVSLDNESEHVGFSPEARQKKESAVVRYIKAEIVRIDQQMEQLGQEGLASLPPTQQ